MGVLCLVLAVAGPAFADVKVLYTGDLVGTIKACGCPGAPAGGIVDVASAVKAERAGGDFLLVDVGNFMPYLQEVRADYTALLMQGMRYDAINVGERELEEGVARVDSLARAYGLPLISASMLRVDTRAPVFRPYTVRAVGKVKVGVIGVTSPDLFALAPESRSKSMTFASLDESLKRWLPEVQKKSDLVVLLGQMSEEEALKVKATYPGIGVVVRGSRDIEREAKPNGAAVIRATRYGTGFGVLNVKVKKGKVTGQEDRKVAFVKGAPVDGEIQKVFDAYQARMAEEVNRASARRAQAPPLPDPEACATCHEAQVTQWRGTPHAHAWATVEKDGRTKDPECMTCHTTRYGEWGGFKSAEVTPKLVNVGCLSCHRLSEGHPNDTAEVPAITPQACISCHDPKNSPAFKYETYLPKVKH
jgi:2',3'-cyclic-nucleotide 2'-phosphodiesterase (5'-nucleotidase family)